MKKDSGLGRRPWPRFERTLAMKNTIEENQKKKKQYVRPQLRTHGSVEQLTQLTTDGPSFPIVFDAKRK
jgi:hypothetical protein